MAALSGSWQYEDVSSANEIDLSSPLSPTLCGIFNDDPAFGDFISEKSSDNPFIASYGGFQLLSAANNSIPMIVPPTYHCYSNMSNFNALDAEKLESNSRETPSGEGEMQDIEIDLDSVLGLDDFIHQSPLPEASVDLLEKNIAPIESFGLLAKSDTVGLEGCGYAAEESFDITQLFSQSEVDEIEEQRSVSSPNCKFEDGRDQDSMTSGDSRSICEFHDEVMNDGSYLGGEFSANSSSVYSSDGEDYVQDQTLDALLRNDWATAESLVNSFGGRHRSKEDPDYKPERRGRKPVSSKSKSWSNVKDKQLRKKQQNKEAATKYRNKKKQEALRSKEIEQSLNNIHRELTEEKEKIASEISTIKKLLLEKFKFNK